MKTAYSREFADLIRNTLKARALSCARAAVLIGVSGSYVQMMVDLGKVPSEAVVERIIRAFPEIDRDEVMNTLFASALPDDPVEAVRIALMKTGLPKEGRDEVIDFLVGKIHLHREEPGDDPTP